MNPTSNSNYSSNGGISNTYGLIISFFLVDPTVEDTNYPIGKLWYNTEASNLWILESFNSAQGKLTATWHHIGTSVEDIDQYSVLLGGTDNSIVSLTPDASTTKVLVSGGTSANPSWQDIDEGAIDLGTFGSTPNAEGASLSGSTLTQQPASNLFPGGVSTAAQSLAGVKTFVSAPILPLTGVLLGNGGSALTDVTPVIDGVLISDHAVGLPSFLANGTAGYVLTANSGAPPSWESGSVASLLVNVQTFTANGTYTPTTDMVWCKIEGCGAGGGGGACDTSASLTASFGGGGGAGEYGFIWASAATIGASKTVTIGAGGAGGTAPSGSGSSGAAVVVDTIITLNGGAGGVGADNIIDGNQIVNAGGVGGTSGSGGDFKTNGDPGAPGQFVYAVTIFGAIGGKGGNSPYGTAGAYSPLTVLTSGGGTTQGGYAASGYGAGGGGASNVSTATSSPGSAAGGAGSQGVIIITEYIKG